MSFSRFLTNCGDIYRLAPTVSSGRTIEAWSRLNATDIIASIQPISEELIALGQGDFYNTYTIYFPINTDIQVGDKYKIGLTDTIEYIIKGVQNRDYGIRQKHIKTSAIRK